MGLIKAAKDSISTLLADQWREYFYCDAIPSDTLVVKGQKRITEGRNSNTKGLDNIISNGSIITVNEGQCMIIVDQGGVVDFCAEAGPFVYDTSSEPSLLYGELGENVKKTFTTIWNRFTFGGNTANDQRVYYFNTKEITGNLYGTATPIDFHLVSPRTGFELETVVKCRGEYSFKIVDPLLFYKNVCGNVKTEYNKTQEDGAKLLSLMKSELLSKLPMALAPIAAQGVLPYQLQNYTDVICEALKVGLSEKWTLERGIEVSSMTIVASVPEEARAEFNKWNNTVMLKDPGMTMADARKVESFAGMMDRTNLSGGDGKSTDPMSGMMSMMAMNMMGGMMNGNNMMGNNMMGGNMNQMQQPVQPTPAVQPVPVAPVGTPIVGWTCSCGLMNQGKFCMECGAKKPEDAGWTCACGHVNQGKFCPECGAKKPAAAPLYKCDKCGWEPEDPTNPPKFCPECGDVFDENDIK